MHDKVTPQPTERGVIDRALFAAVILLIGFGVVMVYSASAVRAASEVNNPNHFVIRQVVFAFLGIFVMLTASTINYHFYKKIIYPLLFLSLLGLFLVHSPVGRTINGASRWIGVGGISMQPAEIMKIVLVLWLSYSLNLTSGASIILVAGGAYLVSLVLKPLLSRVHTQSIG